MKLVVDTNVLFSFFNEKSKARKLSLLPNLELHSPAFSLEEIKKHRSDIIKRFSLSEAQYALIERLLNVVVKFVKEKEYDLHLSEAKALSFDPDDTDFFALALNLSCAIWSEDKLFKKQSKVKVYSTFELSKEFGLKKSD